MTRGVEGIVDLIRGLSPENDHQRSLQSRALTLGEAIVGAHWVILSSVGTFIPVPFLTVLIFWLTITFTSFGLFVPRNATVIAVFLEPISKLFQQHGDRCELHKTQEV